MQLIESLAMSTDRRQSRRDLYALIEPFSESHPDQVLTFFEWCRINRISERTGRRILAGDDGPEVTLLSKRRFGVTVSANRRWQAARTRT
jgi:hypothetical protein